MSEAANAESSNREVVLTVPFDANELDTVRLTLYGVAVRMGFTCEAIEDLKVALTEACNHALMQSGEQLAGAGLSIRFMMRGDELVVRLEGSSCRLSFADVSKGSPLASSAEEEGMPFENESLGLYLMQALVDEVKVLASSEDLADTPDRIELHKRLM